MHLAERWMETVSPFTPPESVLILFTYLWQLEHSSALECISPKYSSPSSVCVSWVWLCEFMCLCTSRKPPHVHLLQLDVCRIQSRPHPHPQTPPSMAAHWEGNWKIFLVFPQKETFFLRIILFHPLSIPTTTKPRLLHCWLAVTMQLCFHGNSS